MSEKSLRLIYARAARHCQLDHNQKVAHYMTSFIHRYFAVDAFYRAEAAAGNIGSCLESLQGTPPDLQVHNQF